MNGGGRAPASRSRRPRPAPPPPPGRIRFPHPGPASGLALAAPPACQGWDLGGRGAGGLGRALPPRDRLSPGRSTGGPPSPRLAHAQGTATDEAGPSSPTRARCGQMWADVEAGGGRGGGARGGGLPFPGAQGSCCGSCIDASKQSWLQANKVGRRLPSLSASTRLRLGLAARRILAGWRRASGQAHGLTWPGGGPPSSRSPPPHTPFHPGRSCALWEGALARQGPGAGMPEGCSPHPHRKGHLPCGAQTRSCPRY